jgi:hypothetical protein
MIVLEVTNDGLDGGSPFQLPLHLISDASFLAGGIDPHALDRWRLVATITGVGDHPRQ